MSQIRNTCSSAQAKQGWKNNSAKAYLNQQVLYQIVSVNCTWQVNSLLQDKGSTAPEKLWIFSNLSRNFTLTLKYQTPPRRRYQKLNGYRDSWRPRPLDITISSKWRNVQIVNVNLDTSLFLPQTCSQNLLGFQIKSLYWVRIDIFPSWIYTER